jgi:hypothetical protein
MIAGNCESLPLPNWAESDETSYGPATCHNAAQKKRTDDFEGGSDRACFLALVPTRDLSFSLKTRSKFAENAPLAMRKISTQIRFFVIDHGRIS